MNIKSNHINKNIIFLILIIFIAFIFKFDLLSTPFFYEEKPYTITTSYNFSFWEILTHQYWRSAYADHHTLLPVSFFLILKPFGYTPFSVHFLMLILSCTGLLLLVKTLQHLAPTKRNLYWIAPIIIFCYPDYFVHMSNYRYDIFAANMAMFAIWARVTNRFKLFILFSLLLSQTRETVVAFFASFILIDFFFLIYDKNKDTIKYIITSFISIILWSTLFIANFINYGKFSSSPASNQVNKTLAEYLNILKFDLKWFFFSDLRWVLSCLTVIIIIYLLKTKQSINKKLLYFFVPIIFYSFGMAFHVFEAVYYLYPTIYLLYGLYAYFILRANLKTYIYFALVPLFIWNFYYLNGKKSYELLKEDSTYYQEVVSNYLDIARYVQKNLRDKSINAEWPIVYYFKDPMYGYVSSPISKIDHRFANVWASILGHKMKDEIQCEDFRNDFEYVITIRHGNNLHKEHQEFYIKKCNYQEIKHIGNQDTYGKIYKKN
jgi:hypothetical protein